MNQELQEIRAELRRQRELLVQAIAKIDESLAALDFDASATR